MDNSFCYPPLAEGSLEEDIPAQCNLESPFWREALAAYENTEQNTLKLLSGFLDKEEHLRREEEGEADKFVYGFFDFPPPAMVPSNYNAVASPLLDSCPAACPSVNDYVFVGGKQQQQQDLKEKEKEWRSCAESGMPGLNQVIFSEETFEIFQEEDIAKVFGKRKASGMKEESDSTPSKKRRRHSFVLTNLAKDLKQDEKGCSEDNVDVVEALEIEEGDGFYRETATAGFTLHDDFGRDLIYDEEVILECFDLGDQDDIDMMLSNL